MKKTVYIEGMMCMHCAAHAKQALEAVEGVTGAEVNLAEGLAVLEGTAGDSELIRAVSEAGYRVTKID